MNTYALFAETEALPLPWWARLLLVFAGLGVWFWTQRLLGARPPLPADEEKVGGRLLVRGDALLGWLAGVHRFLSANPRWANGLLVSSSFVIDAMTLFLLGWSVFGESLRPFLGLLVLFSLRQIFQGLCQLPVPCGVIWRYPGFPSVVVTYGVGNDLFFSGHTALAVYGAIELSRFGPDWMVAIAIWVVAFESLTVLALRAHYTLDVYAGAVTAAFVALLMGYVAPVVDQWSAETYTRLVQ